MKILLPARHGLGDVLNRYFIETRGREILSRVRNGLLSGYITSAMAVYEHFYNPSTGDLLRALPFELLVRRTGELDEVKTADGNNHMPDVVCSHQNVFTNRPPAFDQLDCSELVPCPMSSPNIDLPSNYILFSDGARAADRVLTDPRIYDFLKAATGLPIVKVGCGHDVVPSDINLSEKLTIAETLHVASRARLIVAPLTMFRTCSSLFGTPVIELAEHATPRTLKRTGTEYAGGWYGMTARLNRWFKWPAEQVEIRDTVSRMLQRQRDEGKRQ